MSIVPVRLADVARVDHETDVLVVGFGCAGGAAALEARRTGAEVMVLERASGAGRLLRPVRRRALPRRRHAGAEGARASTTTRRTCSPTSSPRSARTPTRRSCGCTATAASSTSTGSAPSGSTFEESLYDAPSWMPPTRDGLMWLGENAWPFDQLARPVPRGHRPSTEGFGGWLLMERLTATCAEAGVETHTDTRAVALVVDDAGRVVGVTARRFGEDVTYLARRGRRAHHRRLRRQRARCCRTTRRTCSATTRSATASTTAAASRWPPRSAPRPGGWPRSRSPTRRCRRWPCAACWSTRLGRRFVNEDVYPGVFSHAALHQPGPCWVILDEEGLESIPPRDLWGVRPTHAAETLEELEEELGMPPGSLRDTVAAYNEHAAQGRGPLLPQERPLAAPADRAVRRGRPADRVRRHRRPGEHRLPRLHPRRPAHRRRRPGAVGRRRAGAGSVRRGPGHLRHPRRRLRLRHLARATARSSAAAPDVPPPPG